MKVKKVKLPEDCAAAKYLPIDFTEVLGTEVTAAKQLKPDDLQIGFWTDMPAWIRFMFKLRNILVKPFGLERGEGDTNKFVEAIRNGTNNGMMSVADKTDRETVLSLNDKHLKAYLSVYVEPIEQSNQQKVIVITLVKFHKRLGRVYFYTIYPFHCIIVKQQVKRIVKKMIKS